MCADIILLYWFKRDLLELANSVGRIHYTKLPEGSSYNLTLLYVMLSKTPHLILIAIIVCLLMNTHPCDQETVEDERYEDQ